MLQGTRRPATPAEPDAPESPLSAGDRNGRHEGSGRAVASHQQTTVYRFEDVAVISSQGCLRRGDHDHFPRQQVFQILLYLVEQRDRLVTKQELSDRFWQDTAVTDNALVQCIAEIRKVLGDDPREPRFIRTVPRVGYRFIAAVEERELNEEAATAPDGQDVPASSISPGAPRTRVSFRNISRPLWAWLAVAAGCAVVLALLGVVLMRQAPVERPLVTLPQRPGAKPIAVMYFENQSRRPDLNWLREGLADMLITDLARSEKLTVLSRQQLYMLLRRVGRDPAGDIRLADALEVAQKSHADAVVLGSFAGLGEQIVVNFQLYDSRNGQLLAADRLVVNRPGDIPGQVDHASLKLAARLGVPPPESARKANLGEVMTNNLEAYRYYSLGVSKAQGFENAEAVALLRKAIQLDPRFAMAWARIGYAYSVTDFLPETGRPYLEKAFALSDRLSEKDRLYVTGWYAIAREDYPGAVRIFQQIIDQYPLESEAYVRMGLLLLREEKADEAIATLRQGLTLDPESKDLYNALGFSLASADKIEEAIAAHQRYVQLVPKEANAHDSLGMSYQRSGRYDEAIAEYQAALSLNSDFEPAIIHLGDAFAQQGRYRDAVREYQHYARVTRSSAARAVAYGSIAQLYWRKRDFAKGAQAAAREMELEKGAVWNSLLFAVQQGAAARAAILKQALFNDLPYPERGVRHELRSYDYFKGTLDLRDGRTNEAIGWFKEALRHLPPSSGLDTYDDCLANAWLQSGSLDNAIGEYERIMRLNPNYPLAEYHLAQAWARKAQRSKARAAYQQFLRVWQKADADVPEVIDARRELSVN